MGDGNIIVLVVLYEVPTQLYESDHNRSSLSYMEKCIQSVL